LIQEIENIDNRIDGARKKNRREYAGLRAAGLGDVAQHAERPLKNCKKDLVKRGGRKRTKRLLDGSSTSGRRVDTIESGENGASFLASGKRLIKKWRKVRRRLGYKEKRRIPG